MHHHHHHTVAGWLTLQRLPFSDRLASYFESQLRRRRYEGDHWDGVITKYRELLLPMSRLPTDVADMLQPVFEHFQVCKHTAPLLARCVSSFTVHETLVHDCATRYRNHRAQ